MARSGLLAVAASLALATPVCPSAEASATVEWPETIQGTQHVVHQSKLLDRTVHLFIKTSQLAEPAKGPLPIIYVLDGDEAFPLLAAYTHYMTFADEMPPSILVGIAYGTSVPSINKRSTDFTAPAESNADYGGAGKFLEVLEKEILPLVEGRVAADPERRTIVGQSLGGQFVLFSALERPGLFDLSIAVNPALHRNLDYFLSKLAEAKGERKSRLYVSSADHDDPRFREPALKWMAAASASKTVPACVKTETLADETHLSSLPRAFRNAVRWAAQPDGCAKAN